MSQQLVRWSITYARDAMTIDPVATQNPTSNTTATYTITPPDVNSAVILASLPFSYSADPAAGSELTITYTYNSNTYVDHYKVSKGGPFVIPFSPPKRYPTGIAVTIGLSAAGVGIFGTLPSPVVWFD